MPNEPIITPGPNATSNDPAELRNDSQTGSISTPHLISLCALGLLICFFLPWIQILFGRPSGFDFAKEGDFLFIFWALPFFCVVTVLAGITKIPVRGIAQFTGCLPFAILCFGFYKIGPDLLKILAVGAYVGLGLGLALLVLPRNLK